MKVILAGIGLLYNSTSAPKSRLSRSRRPVYSTEIPETLSETVSKLGISMDGSIKSHHNIGFLLEGRSIFTEIQNLIMGARKSIYIQIPVDISNGISYLIQQKIAEHVAESREKFKLCFLTAYDNLEVLRNLIESLKTYESNGKINLSWLCYNKPDVEERLLLNHTKMILVDPEVGYPPEVITAKGFLTSANLSTLSQSVNTENALTFTNIKDIAHLIDHWNICCDNAVYSLQQSTGGKKSHGKVLDEISKELARKSRLTRADSSSNVQFFFTYPENWSDCRGVSKNLNQIVANYITQLRSGDRIIVECYTLYDKSIVVALYAAALREVQVDIILDTKMIDSDDIRELCNMRNIGLNFCSPYPVHKKVFIAYRPEGSNRIPYWVITSTHNPGSNTKAANAMVRLTDPNIVEDYLDKADKLRAIIAESIARGNRYSRARSSSRAARAGSRGRSESLSIERSGRTPTPFVTAIRDRSKSRGSARIPRVEEMSSPVSLRIPAPVTPAPVFAPETIPPPPIAEPSMQKQVPYNPTAPEPLFEPGSFLRRAAAYAPHDYRFLQGQYLRDQPDMTEAQMPDMLRKSLALMELKRKAILTEMHEQGNPEAAYKEDFLKFTTYHGYSQ